MDGLKRLLERYFGVPAADPGQGTAWEFRYDAPWPGWFPDWGVLLVGMAVVGFVVWVYRRDARSVPTSIRVLLPGLRLMLLACVLLFLTRMTLSISRTGLPVLVVMLDVSASMGLEDQYPDAKSQRAAKQLGGKEPTRAKIARALLTQRNAAFLKKLQRRHKLRVYRFAESATPIGRGEYVGADEIKELVGLLGSLRSEGDETRPGPALRKVLDELRGMPPTAIIILTDGVASTGESDKLSTVATLAGSRMVPLFAIGIGSEEPSRDVQLYDLLVDEVAFVDDPITFVAKLRGFGYEGEAATVLLKRKGEDAVLASRPVTVPADGEPTKIELTYVPPEAGEFDFVLEVTPLAKENNSDNNSEMRHVSVRRERIRVLLVDSVPRYEFRFVKHLLERDKTVELHSLLQEADLAYSAEDETAIEHFPVKWDDLAKYDVVIFGDVNPSYLSPSVIENLQRFVREKGGGLMLVAGPYYNPAAYRGTPLDAMLPVQLDAVTVPAADTPIPIGFRPTLTIEGRKGSSIFRFTEGERESHRIWRQFPELYWFVEARELKAGAVVFAEHPSRNGAERRLPIISMQRYGAGKVLFHATDELWRWRKYTGDTYYGRYWVQAIRYLSRSKLLGRDKTAELTVDRRVYQRGENVHLRVRFLDDRLAPVEDNAVSVVIEKRGETQHPVKLSRVAQAPNVFEGRFSRPAEGTYHAWVSSPAFDEAPPSTDFRVEVPVRELTRRSLDRADLVQAAEMTHGKYASFADADELLSAIPPGRPVPLQTGEPIPIWNRWEFLLFFTALLLAEWLLRKCHRLI